MKRISLLVFLSVIYIQSFSQEFICSVSVNSSKMEGTDKRVYESLQTSLQEFVNNRVWTNYSFQPDERIECSMMITIDERVSADEFKGKLNLVLRRPVYKSTYNTPIFNYVDENVQFRYIEHQTIDFVQNSYSSNLTSIIAYYLYIYLGMDFDTFSLNGGTQFYKIAESIATTAQSSPYGGWKAYESMKNRYWLVENLLNPQYRDIRKFMYEYHRLGLDVMSENVAEGRSIITKSLEYLKKVNDEKINLFILQLIIEAKRDEFMNIYSEGSSMEKTAAKNILTAIDPSNAGRYNESIK